MSQLHSRARADSPHTQRATRIAQPHRRRIRPDKERRQGRAVALRNVLEMSASQAMPPSTEPAMRKARPIPTTGGATR